MEQEANRRKYLEYIEKYLEYIDEFGVASPLFTTIMLLNSICYHHPLDTQQQLHDG